MPPAIKQVVLVARLKGFVTKRIRLIAKQKGLVTKRTRFITKRKGFITKRTRLIAKQTRFATKRVSPVTKRICLTTKRTSFTIKFLTLINNRMNKVVIDISHEADDSISATVGAAITGITGNANFTMVAPLAALVSAKAAYDPALAACEHGNEADTTLKNQKKVLLSTAYRAVAVQVNVQANGDRIKALSSGCTLEKEGSHQVMGEVVNFKVTVGSVAGYMDFSADKPKTFSTHGIIFSYWDPALGPTPTDKNKWFQRHSNGTSLTIGGFTPGVSYPFAAAYKGLDNEVLVWTATMNKMASD